MNNTMIIEPDPVYYDKVTFAGRSFELYRAKWTVRRTIFVRWYAHYEGQIDEAFRNTRSDTPAGAIGMAILLMNENDAVSDRLWGGAA